MVKGTATCLMAIMNVYSSWSLVDSVDGGILRIDQGLVDRRQPWRYIDALRSMMLVLEQSTTLAGYVCLVITMVLPTFWCRAAAISKAYRVCFGEGCNAAS